MVENPCVAYPLATVMGLSEHIYGSNPRVRADRRCCMSPSIIEVKSADLAYNL